MAKQRDGSVVSDEILMQFMKDVKKSVDEIRESVSRLSLAHVKNTERLENHIANEKTVKGVEDAHDKKRTVYVALISILVGLIIFGLGYIWRDKKENNERVQESIERPFERSQGR